MIVDRRVLVCMLEVLRGKPGRLMVSVFSHFCPSIPSMLELAAFAVDKDGLQLSCKEPVSSPAFFYVLLPFTE